jgi:ATP-dependent Clp protease ATP-binding subunit ClpA
MTHITIEELLQRKQELIQERDERLKMTAVGYDNAIAVIDELIKMAMSRREETNEDN